MKEILMFILPGCPHCKLALRCQEELLREHPEWQSIPLHIVDESREQAFAEATTTTMSQPGTWTGRKSLRPCGKARRGAGVPAGGRG